MKQIIPIPTELNIEKFEGATILVASSFIENGMIEKYPEGKTYVTHRPSFTTIQDASAEGVGTRGRGIYYWHSADKLYIVNYDTIYETNYSATCTESGGSLSANYSKVHFAELGDELFLLDVAGNQAFYATDATATTFTLISDAQFPGHAGMARTLQHGCAVLDNTLYVLANDNATDNAEIYGCELGDVVNWTALNFVTAYKSNDRGVYLGKHHNDIVVFGTESIEFFYDAANPSPGSPLSSRPDVFYNIGCADGQSVYTDNDEIFFVGKAMSSGIGVFKLSNHQLEKISVPSLDSYLTTAMTNYSVDVIGSGLTAAGRSFYIITLYDSTGTIVNPLETIVYDTRTKSWTFWEHASTAVDQFPLVGWTIANNVSGSASSTGKGILSNGDYIECLDDLYSRDRAYGGLYVAADYVADDYVTEISSDGDQIILKARIGHIDFGTRAKKFMHELRPICDQTEEEQTLTIRYTDDGHTTYNPDRTLNLGNDNDKLTRLGQFRNRTFEIEYAGDEVLRLEGLEVEVVQAGV